MDRTLTANQIHDMADPFRELAGKWITHIGDTALNPPMAIEHVGTHIIAIDEPDHVAVDFTVWPKDGSWMIGINICSNPHAEIKVQITDSEPHEPHTPGDYGNADPV